MHPWPYPPSRSCCPNAIPTHSLSLPLTKPIPNFHQTCTILYSPPPPFSPWAGCRCSYLGYLGYMLMSQPELPRPDPVAQGQEEALIGEPAPPPVRKDVLLVSHGRSWDLNPPIVTPGCVRVL